LSGIRAAGSGSRSGCSGRFLQLIVALNDAGKAEVLDTLAHGALVADGESAVEVVLFLVKVGSAHVMEAALVDLGPRRPEGRDLALGVAIEGCIGSGGSSGGGHGQGGESGKGEDGDLHGEFVCVLWMRELDF
jgi:hypothetical protein